MSEDRQTRVHTRVADGTGIVTLDRPQALHSLSLDMVRDLTAALLAWRDDPAIAAVVIGSTGERAFCAGGDIRFFHRAGSATPQGGSALIEDFFTEEYTLDFLVQTYPKPYIALMDGVVMGGGMGIAQARTPGSQGGLRIVTERTKMAMPEVNIGFFPDVGASHFLSRAPGRIGAWLGLAGAAIGAADALYAGLADLFVPSGALPALRALLEATPGTQLPEAIRAFAAPFAGQAGAGELAVERGALDAHFGHETVAAIVASLESDAGTFARRTLQTMRQRSPLMQCVTLAMLARGARLGLADCLRMERDMVRHAFEIGEVLEGVRALAVDKDNRPRWHPPALEDVTPDMVERFFAPVWPAHAHPLRML